MGLLKRANQFFKKEQRELDKRKEEFNKDYIALVRKHDLMIMPTIDLRDMRPLKKDPQKKQS